MKVYVVVEDWQFDDGECGTETYVFETLAQAQGQMGGLSLDIKKVFENNFKDNYDVDKNDMSVSYYESGEYCYNHHNVAIYEREIR